MLDGSLIALFAKSLGVSCASLFFDMAVDVKPKAKMDAENLRSFAEEACRFDNPDQVFQAAYIRSGFLSRYIKISNGQTYALDSADSLLVRLNKKYSSSSLPTIEDYLRFGARENFQAARVPRPTKGVYTGIFHLNFRRLYDRFGGDLGAAIHPKAHIKWLSSQGTKFQTSPNRSWVKDFFLKGSSEIDRAAWLSSEIVLAKALRKRLLKNSKDLSSVTSLLRNRPVKKASHP